MIVEKLALYHRRPQEIFERLIESWSQQRFELRQVDGEALTLLCKGRSDSQVRVDIATQCFATSDGTLVHMIYSPILTPALFRRFDLSTLVRERILDDVVSQMEAVLDAVGDWQTISYQAAVAEGHHLPDSKALHKQVNQVTGRLRAMFGLGVLSLGGLMAYLEMSGFLSFGSTQFWLTMAMLGIVIFALGLFNLFQGCSVTRENRGKK